MVVRLFLGAGVGAGLFALGYLLGREIGRSESIRDELRWVGDGEGRLVADAEPDAPVVETAEDDKTA
ncbi:MAG: hypothetical protein U9Q81_02815 [Pseudomonadota bacterium]|nr:hypothetical protein [Pseudomonadota bacterium]